MSGIYMPWHCISYHFVNLVCEFKVQISQLHVACMRESSAFQGLYGRKQMYFMIFLNAPQLLPYPLIWLFLHCVNFHWASGTPSPPNKEMFPHIIRGNLWFWDIGISEKFKKNVCS